MDTYSRQPRNADMRYPRTHTVSDELLDIDVLTYLDCDIEVSIDWDNGEPVMTVEAVYVDGKNLFNGSPLSRQIAAAIASLAEDDEDLIARAVEDDGIVYVGAPNDPSGHFRQVQ